MNSAIILASASPQRKTLLESTGLKFSIIPSSIIEAQIPERDPAKRAVLLAREKALDVATANAGTIVIGADTLVVAPDGTLLEKPSDAEDARRMLKLQSGGMSIVHSGVCVVGADGKTYEGLSSSGVRFGTLTDAEVDWWVDSGLWKDRSGAFQLEGPAQLLIERVEGDVSGIIGLPLRLLKQLLEQAGYMLL